MHERFDMEFEWPRDLKQRFTLRKVNSYWRIVRGAPYADGELSLNFPLQNEDIAYRMMLAFAQVTDSEQALAFVNTYGPLTRAGYDAKEGEAVHAILRDSSTAKDLLWAFSEGRTADILDRIDLGMVVPLQAYFRPPWWDQTREQVPRLVLKPEDLRCAIHLLIFKRLSEKATLRRCQLCGAFFEAGRKRDDDPDSKRRTLHARFCSDEHRIQYHRPAGPPAATLTKEQRRKKIAAERADDKAQDRRVKQIVKNNKRIARAKAKPKLSKGRVKT